MANIDALYTGNTGLSATFGNEDVSQDQEEVISEQKRQIAELMPSVAAMLQTCDDEIAAISDIRAYIKTIGNRPTKSQLEAEYAGRELAIGFIERFKQSLLAQVSNAEQVAK